MTRALEGLPKTMPQGVSLSFLLPRLEQGMKGRLKGRLGQGLGCGGRACPAACTCVEAVTEVMRLLVWLHHTQ